MRHMGVAGCVLLAVAGSAAAQNGTVDFRIRELTGQATITSSADAVLDFVVEARVSNALNRGLGDWSFNVVIQNEAENRGTLARLRINQGDGSLFTGAPTTSTSAGGVAGVASQYRYLVGLNSAFNGVINASSGTFVNNPLEQEIGLVAGSARGATLANTGIIVDNGSGFAPATGQDYIDAINGYFGANGNYVQLYRFRYTVTDLTTRNYAFELEAVTAATFANLVPAGTDYSADTTGGAAAVTTSGFHIIFPAPATAPLLGLGGLAIARRRR